MRDDGGKDGATCASVPLGVRGTRKVLTLGPSLCCLCVQMVMIDDRYRWVVDDTSIVDDKRCNKRDREGRGEKEGGERVGEGG